MEKLSHKTYTIELSASGRFKLTSRALFIFASELFAIFQVSICGGLKPPLFSCFFYRFAMKKTLAWHGMVGPFKFQRAFFCVNNISVVFLYINSFPL